MQLFHSTKKDTLIAHEGLCLTPDRGIHGEYGGTVFEVELNLEGAKVLEVETNQDNYDNNSYPGDTWQERDAYTEDGVQILVYRDWTVNGTEHTTYRVLDTSLVSSVELAD